MPPLRSCSIGSKSGSAPRMYSCTIWPAWKAVICGSLVRVEGAQLVQEEALLQHAARVLHHLERDRQALHVDVHGAQRRAQLLVVLGVHPGDAARELLHVGLHRVLGGDERRVHRLLAGLEDRERHRLQEPPSGSAATVAGE
jgi:hypothetical protein